MAFVSAPSALLRQLHRPRLCRVRRGNVPKPNTRPLLMVSGETVDPALYEDDDATLGDRGPVYGMQLPDLTDDDKKFLDAATSNEDFMARMTRIAHRLDQNRKKLNRARGREGPEEYMESLKRPPRDFSNLPTAVSQETQTADDYMDSLKRRQPDISNLATETGHPPAGGHPGISRKVREVDNEIGLGSSAKNGTEAKKARMKEEVQAEKRRAGMNEISGQVGGDKNLNGGLVGEDDATAALEREIELLEEELEGVAGESEQKEDVGVLDNEISALEGRLSMLQGDSGSTGTQVDVSGQPEEMSEAEKMEVFEVIRRRAMVQREQGWTDELVDPLARDLPFEKMDDRISNDVPDTSDTATATAGHAFAELEEEMRSYRAEAQSMLDAHTQRVKAIMNRLRDQGELA